MWGGAADIISHRRPTGDPNSYLTTVPTKQKK